MSGRSKPSRRFGKMARAPVPLGMTAARNSTFGPGVGALDIYRRLNQNQPGFKGPASAPLPRSTQLELADIVGPTKAPMRLSGIYTRRLGRVRKGNRIVSARLNPELVEFVVADAIPSDADMKNIETELLGKIAPGESPTDTTNLAEPAEGGGNGRQRGGADTWAEWASAKAAFTKSITLMTLYTFADVAKMAGTSPAAVGAKDAVVTYLTQELRPLGDAGKKFAIIVVYLVEQVFIKTPITAVMFATAGLGYTANFVRYIFDISNTKVRAVATDLLKDEKAAKAAAAALDSVKSVGTTAGVGIFVAQQIGVLPLSAVLAAILFTLQVNLGTGGGRAYLVAGFYAWYKGQKAEDQAEINRVAAEYGTAVKAAAKSGAEAAKTSATKTAAVLGPLLQKAGKGGKNAVQAVAAAVKRAVPTNAEPAVVDPTAALQNGAPAAAIAADQVAGTGGSGGRRGKTSKRGMKRRMTRRRKAPKYLAAPVFAY